VKDSSEAIFIKQFLQEYHGGNTPVVVPDHVRNVSRLDRIDHGTSLFRCSSERLFAEDHFAGACGSNRNFSMGIVRTGDVDKVDIVTRNQFPPVGLYRLVTPVFGKLLTRSALRAHTALSTGR